MMLHRWNALSLSFALKLKYSLTCNYAFSVLLKSNIKDRIREKNMYTVYVFSNYVPFFSSTMFAADNLFPFVCSLRFIFLDRLLLAG